MRSTCQIPGCHEPGRTEVNGVTTCGGAHAAGLAIHISEGNIVVRDGEPIWVGEERR